MLASKMCLSLLISLSVLTQTSEGPPDSKRTQSLVDKLRKESQNSLSVRWSEVTQTPELIEGNLTKPSRHSPEWITYEYFERIKLLYDLKNVKEDLRILSVVPDHNGTRLYLQRLLYGKPVCGEQLVVEIDSRGVLQRIEGALHAGLEMKRLRRPMYAAVTLEEAKRAALAYDSSLKGSAVLRMDSCYLPDRTGVPLVHKITFEKENRTVAVTVHSMTGQVIE
ncbi:PepSY domain-containing protein [Paenibacillus whitsoniae]|uniref:FTP domain-containing protein n=1 Tax=Paenibacillus whitsoniae TaxID=2496558 RepID=A0A430JK89_9BACL|nr:PepSY domain-containing protein [Paenibacillus whitsoniae]RTE11474.1 hypothetical protein EJQ19_01370 [Paenibacillus whitsoniae]